MIDSVFLKKRKTNKRKLNGDKKTTFWFVKILLHFSSTNKERIFCKQK